MTGTYSWWAHEWRTLLPWPSSSTSICNDANSQPACALRNTKQHCSDLPVHVERRLQNKKLHSIIEYIWMRHDMQATSMSTTPLMTRTLKTAEHGCSWPGEPDSSLLEECERDLKDTSVHSLDGWCRERRLRLRLLGASMALEVPVCCSSCSSPLIYSCSFTHSVHRGIITCFKLHPPSNPPALIGFFRVSGVKGASLCSYSRRDWSTGNEVLSSRLRD